VLTSDVSNVLEKFSKMDVSETRQKTLDVSTTDIKVEPTIIGDLPANSFTQTNGLVAGPVTDREVNVITEHITLPPVIRETIIPVIVKEIHPEITRVIEQTEIIRRIEQTTQARVEQPVVIESTTETSRLPTTVVGPRYVLIFLTLNLNRLDSNDLILLFKLSDSKVTSC